MQTVSEVNARIPAQSSPNVITAERKVYIGDKPDILTEIYQEDSNIVIWERDFSKSLKICIADFLQSNPTFQLSITLSSTNAVDVLYKYLGANEKYTELSENIAELIDMYTYLFSLERVGLRLTSLDRAMCPKFHVDRVPCRLVTTYAGFFKILMTSNN